MTIDMAKEVFADSDPNVADRIMRAMVAGLESVPDRSVADVMAALANVLGQAFQQLSEPHISIAVTAEMALMVASADEPRVRLDS
jgi:type II secretory pathway predicted ATPase ExeA